MMRIPTRGSVTLTVLALALGLAGCTVDGDGNIDLSSPGAVRNMSCRYVQEAVTGLTDLKNETTSPGERNRLERDLNINVDDDLDAATGWLDERAEECDDNDAEPESTTDPDPSESPSSEPSENPDDDADDTDDSVLIRSIDGIEGWDQLPDSALNRIERHSGDIGFTADDARTWSVATLPSGNLTDARVVLIFGDMDGTSRSEARSLADVSRKTPVVRVKSCDDIVGQGCTDGEIRVILAPLVLGEDGVVQGLKPGTGVMLKGNFPIISYTS